jgi:HK97 family phage prohead protease
MSEVRFKQLYGKIVKSPTDGSGRFRAIVSTYGPPPDVQGDVIEFGAYAKSIVDAKIRRDRAGGLGLWGLWWNHGKSAPENVIGLVVGAEETPDGLVIDGLLALEQSDLAVTIYEKMLSGMLNEFSIGYILHKERKHPAGYHLREEIELTEVSVVAAGANRYTRLLDVKSAERNDPRYWSSKVAELTPAGARSDGLSPDAAAFLAGVRAQVRAERAEETERHELWLSNANLARSEVGMTEDEYMERDRRRIAAEVADVEARAAERGSPIGSTVRVAIDPDGVEGSVRVAEEDLHSGRPGGELR